MKKMILFLSIICFLGIVDLTAQTIIGTYEGNRNRGYERRFFSLEITEVTGEYYGSLKAYAPKVSGYGALKKRSNLIGEWRLKIIDLDGKKAVTILQEKIKNRNKFDFDVSKFRITISSNNISIYAGRDYRFKMIRNERRSKKLVSSIKKSNPNQKLDNISSVDAKRNFKNFDGFWDGTVYNENKRLVDYKLYLSEENSWLKFYDRYESPTYFLKIKKHSTDKIILTSTTGLDFEITDSRYKNSAQFNILSGKYRSNGRRRINKPIIPRSATSISDRAIIYRDWSADSEGYQNFSRSEDHEKRLKNMFDKLYGTRRWKCLFQSTVWVEANRPEIYFIHPRASTSLSLIYAPTGNYKLNYKVTGYGSHSNNYDYPVFYSEVGGQSKFKLKLEIQPLKENPNLFQSKIPVTIYTFGGSFGDTGPGCEFSASNEVSTYTSLTLLFGQLAYGLSTESQKKVIGGNNSEVNKNIENRERKRTLKAVFATLFPSEKDNDKRLDFYVKLAVKMFDEELNLKNIDKPKLEVWLNQKANKISPYRTLSRNELDIFYELYVSKLSRFGGGKI